MVQCSSDTVWCSLAHSFVAKTRWPVGRGVSSKVTILGVASEEEVPDVASGDEDLGVASEDEDGDLGTLPSTL